MSIAKKQMLFDMSPETPKIYLTLGVYAGLNLLFLLLYFMAAESFAFMLPSIEWLTHAIPVITQPVEWLVEHGNLARANLVKHIYGFNWLSFIFLSPFFLAMTAYLLSNYYKRHSFLHLTQEKRDTCIKALRMLPIAIFIIFIFLLIAFVNSYYGIFQFEGLPCKFKNCVHKRDFDLLRLTFFISVAIGALQLLSILVVSWWLAYKQGKNI